MAINNLNWYGHFNAITGYGVVNLEYSLALQNLGIDVSLGWSRFAENHGEWKYLTPEQRKLMSKPFKRERVGIIKSLPTEFYHNESDIRIGYTMVENTKINNSWVSCCNQMNAMFVPSEFVATVFRDCGVKVPVYSVRQGINDKVYKFVKRVRKPKFIFGIVGYMDERKNWRDLITAFISEFEPQEPVELWIKNSNDRWGFINIEDDRVKFIHKRYTFEEMARLYSLMDCFVFPSHAEGSGLPPREAMATGLPVILTNFSGLTEIAKEEISYPLTPVSIDFPDYRKEEQPGFQARIDIRELMFYMRYVYENWDKAMEKGEKAAEFIKKEYCWETCAGLLLKRLEEFL